MEIWTGRFTPIANAAGSWRIITGEDRRQARTDSR
jgi:hypothetical protein